MELSKSVERSGCGEHRNDEVIDGNDTEKQEERGDFFESSMVLAKRLLFLAYCELDGGQVASARQRLVSGHVI